MTTKLATLVRVMTEFEARAPTGRIIRMRNEDARLYQLSPPVSFRRRGQHRISAAYVIITMRTAPSVRVFAFAADAEGRALSTRHVWGDDHGNWVSSLKHLGYTVEPMAEAVAVELEKDRRRGMLGGPSGVGGANGG